MVHHILTNNLECLYCADTSSDKEWFSQWTRDHHYKTFICKSCGRKNFVKVKWDGSGHDSFGGLEKKVV